MTSVMLLWRLLGTRRCIYGSGGGLSAWVLWAGFWLIVPVVWGTGEAIPTQLDGDQPENRAIWSIFMCVWIVSWTI